MADQTISFVVPDAYTGRVLTTLRGLAGERITLLSAHGDGMFTMPTQGDDETVKAFVERCTRLMFKTLMISIDMRNKIDERSQAIAAIPEAVTDIPDDIVTEVPETP